MYCLPGYATLKDLEYCITEIVMPDGVLTAELLPKAVDGAKIDHTATYRLGTQIVADAMEAHVGFSIPAFATSPDGLCLRMSSAFFASMIGVGLSEQGRNDLACFYGEPTFIFIEPSLYFLSTAKWENVDQKTWRQHVDDASLFEWQLLAVQVEKFEGWGVSIRESDMPKTLVELADSLPPTGLSAGQETSCTPNAVLTEFAKNPGITKYEMRLLFPGVSVRRFNHVWARAADTDPSLSKPGRKPTGD